MTSNFKTMLAATYEPHLVLDYPLLASPKLDGIRAILERSNKTDKRILYSRTLKPIPNLHIRNTVQNSNLPEGLDGELIVGNNFQSVCSAIMSVDGEPNFTYHVFDYFGDGINLPFAERYAKLCDIVQRNGYPWLRHVPHVLIRDKEELDMYEQAQLNAGYEGVMLRSLKGLYKYGKATQKSQTLLKVKRFKDAEAHVIGFQELMLEGSTASTQMLGALICRDQNNRWNFNVGSGFTENERYNIWLKRDSLMGAVLTYKYQNHGLKTDGKPRMPIFLRWKLDHKL